VQRLFFRKKTMLSPKGLQQLANSPGLPDYPTGYCEIAPQGHFLALRAQGATSACGLLAMTIRERLPF